MDHSNKGTDTSVMIKVISTIVRRDLDDELLVTVHYDVDHSAGNMK